MRRIPVLLSILAVVLLGVMAETRGGFATGQESTIPDLVGSWNVVAIAADGRTLLSMSTFGADGTVLTSRTSAEPAPPGTPPGVVLVSTAHGAWEATGPDTAITTFVHLRVNGEGLLIGTSTVRLSITLGADGDTFSGNAEATLADPAGNTLATFASTVQGTRIVAEAPGTPAATPEA